MSLSSVSPSHHRCETSTRSHVYYKSISFCNIQFPRSQLFCGRVPLMLRSLSDGISSLCSCWDRRDPLRSPHMRSPVYTETANLNFGQQDRMGLFTCKYMLSLHKAPCLFYCLPNVSEGPDSELLSAYRGLTYSVKAPYQELLGRNN